MAVSREGREAERARERERARQQLMWDMAKKGSKIAKKQLLIKGGKKK